MNAIEPDPLSGRDLAAFVAAVETRSIHGAADALGLTQSAVSKRIQSLERRTGAHLLDRSQQGIVPTAAGLALYPEAKEALTALKRAAAAAVVTMHEEILHLAASHTIGEFLLPGLLAEFRHADGRPSRTEIDIVNSTGVLKRLRDGEVSIGFVEGIDGLSGVESVTITRDELVIAVSPSHRWAAQTAISAGELTTEPYYARERDSGTRAVLADALARHGVALEAVLETRSIQGLKRTVLSGGFTVLSRLAVEAEVREGTLRCVAIDGVDLHRELRAVRCERERDAAPSRTAARLWAWLREQAP